MYGLRINKSESPDKSPYTLYYPHTIRKNKRVWDSDYYQVISIDPGRINYALRVERRYKNGRIIPIVFDKTSVESIVCDGENIICDTYKVLTEFLDKYSEVYQDCHFVIIERQLPQNYKATRIAQHTISYFSITLHNAKLLPEIIEVDPKLKGRMLKVPVGTNEKQLKSWAVVTAKKLLLDRDDIFSLQVLDHFAKKQDDLCDTICQIEALFIYWISIGFLTN